VRKVEDISLRDTPGQQEVRDIAHDAAAAARLGRLRAIAVVTIANGQETDARAFAGLSRTDRLLLIAELENLKAALRD